MDYCLESNTNTTTTKLVSTTSMFTEHRLTLPEEGRYMGEKEGCSDVRGLGSGERRRK